MANNSELHQTEPARARGEALAEAWFRSGERVAYDPATRTLSDAGDGPLQVWLRRDGDVTTAVTFLPGFPDGSIGWSKVVSHLPSAVEMPKLFTAEYPGPLADCGLRRQPHGAREWSLEHLADQPRRHRVGALLHTDGAPGYIVISGLIYDVRTGRARQVIPPAPLRR